MAECPPGFYRSKITGHCRKDKLKPCPEGYLRDEKTRRCKKIKSLRQKILKPCPEGYLRDEKTRRCKKIDKKTKKTKDCPPGFSRTGKNNRCQKDCPPGTTRSTKNNRCLKDCAPGRVRNSVGRCVKDSFIVEEDEPLEGEGERWMDEEVAELRKGRLGKDLRPKITCLEMFDDDALRKELDKRKRVREAPIPPPGATLYKGQVVNMLVARRKKEKK